MHDWTTKLRWVFAASLVGGAGCGSTDTSNSNTGSTACPRETRRVPLDTDAGITAASDAGLDCNARCRGFNVGQVERCEVAAADGGLELVCYVTTLCPGGRTTAGLELPAIPNTSTGALLAAMGAMESASVQAFARLARELRAHDAPPALRRDAHRAARDERRHARALAALARRYGAAPQQPRGEARATRSLAALVRENAVEGCVRETWGALLAAWQSGQADDPRVRAAFARIADDELRHAALAWEIAAWAEPQLSPAEAAEVRAAREASWEALHAELLHGAGEGHPELGLPSPAAARALLASLRAGLATAVNRGVLPA